jgi:hypothetical protein
MCPVQSVTHVSGRSSLKRQNATFHVAHSISVDDYIAIEPKP